jgi:hypothetical protein
MKNNWRALRTGVGSILDLSGSETARRLNRRVFRSDAEALQADWKAIGRDMKRVIGQPEENK